MKFLDFTGERKMKDLISSKKEAQPVVLAVAAKGPVVAEKKSVAFVACSSA